MGGVTCDGLAIVEVASAEVVAKRLGADSSRVGLGAGSRGRRARGSSGCQRHVIEHVSTLAGLVAPLVALRN